MGSLLLFFLLLFPLQASAQEVLVLNTCHMPPYHLDDQTGISDQLLHQLFSRVGLKIFIQSLPPERALINANMGLAAGDAGRVAGIEKNFPNLIRVPELLETGKLVAFSKNFTFSTDSWASLNPYNVAHINGHKGVEAYIDNPKSLLVVKDMKLLFELLAKDRTDIVVCELLAGLSMIKQLNLRNIRVLEPPLATIDTYLYLHKDHAALVPQLNTALQNMKQDGTYDQINSQGHNLKGAANR
ncbi:MAG: transporter substrate-binding domain-containing protein [Proteobacteria bacterium]|nr:transporter substrate-binding domain-containing protein [Pseudomonadota bacterium]MBU1709380.1 transporter substrate-binding domain-containing protein [Pseudomonadota bacterium]